MNNRYCAFCGQRLPELTRFCGSCGAAVDAPPAEQQRNVEAPYADGNSGNAEDILLRTFVNKDVYITKWNNNSYWNWPAFLFGPMWLGYRKMYVEMLLYLALIFFLFIIEIALDYPSLFSIIYLGAQIALGVYANKLYYKKAKKQVQSILHLHHQVQTQQFVAGQKGGTAKWGIVIGAAALLCVSFAMVQLEESGDVSSVSGVMNRSSSIVFAEHINDRLEPVKSGTVFTTGVVEMLLKTNTEFNTNKVNITVKLIKNGSEQIIDTDFMDVDPRWGQLSFAYEFEAAGTYAVSIYRSSGDLLGEGTVTIR